MRRTARFRVEERMHHQGRVLNWRLRTRHRYASAESADGTIARQLARYNPRGWTVTQREPGYALITMSGIAIAFEYRVVEEEAR